MKNIYPCKLPVLNLKPDSLPSPRQLCTHKYTHKLGLVADPVIEAIARLEFEDGLRTGVLLGGCWDP